MPGGYQDGAGWIDTLGAPEGAEVIEQSGTLALTGSLQDICSKVVTPTSDVRIVVIAKLCIRQETNGYPADGTYARIVIEINGTEYDVAKVDFLRGTASNNPYQSQTAATLVCTISALASQVYTIKLRAEEIGSIDYLAQEGKMIVMLASEADL